MTESTAAGYAQGWQATDEFGVPANLFDHHQEDFFARLARLVMIAALLEHRLLFFYQALKGIAQHKGASLPASTILQRIHEGLNALPALSDRVQVQKSLDECREVLERRNDYVHNLWPAQDGDRVYGWRFAHKATPASPTKFVDLTAADMQADVARFVLAVRTWERLYTLVSGGQHLARTEGPA